MIIRTESGTIFECSAQLPIDKKLDFLFKIAMAVEEIKKDKDATNTLSIRQHN